MNSDLLLCKAKLESKIYNHCVVGYYRETKKGEHIVYTKTGLEFIVDPETVCQCTGLKDKNGILIFEGDIVIVCDEYADEAYETIVINGTNNGYPAFDLKDTITDESNSFSYISCTDSTIEVVGNIHHKLFLQS